jgi:hypothetical protein
VIHDAEDHRLSRDPSEGTRKKGEPAGNAVRTESRPHLVTPAVVSQHQARMIRLPPAQSCHRAGNASDVPTAASTSGL